MPPVVDVTQPSATLVLDRIEAHRALGEAICRCIDETLVRLGFDDASGLRAPVYDDAEFRLVIDPYSQSRDLTGDWFDSRRRRLGRLQFHGDGGFYAEYDVVRPHPGKPRLFIEAIHAWGRRDDIKVEAKLLDMPSD